jgi:rhamnose utilization protein RhaD (predicted bifunctional aldolase and dehydrogenase)/NAD(P)-dependent dehydrogenase (short-subunit alcohol dehydrogenase family)
MESRWSEEEARAFVDRLGGEWGEALALRVYSSRLLGAEPSLVLHGGGNTSVKAAGRDAFGREVAALYVKASGRDLALVEPADFVALDLGRSVALHELPGGDDARLLTALLALRLNPAAPAPSLEAPVHALLPPPFLDHTHADAILALTNRPDGEEVARAALGDGVILLPYVLPGLDLARAAAAAASARRGAAGMVWMLHGLLTWGRTARESYERTIELASRAEQYLAREAGASRRASPAGRRRGSAAGPAPAATLLPRIAPVVRGLLARPVDDPDRPFRRVILLPLADEATLAFLALPGARELAATPPLTTDHLIRTGRRPLWLAEPALGEPERLRGQLRAALDGFAREEQAFFAAHRERLPPGVESFDPLPRVVLVPGLGAFAAGATAAEAGIARDITAQTLAVKLRLARAGVAYRGLAAEHLFDMLYRPYQHRKLARGGEPLLAGTVALVTGAAGAIGAGISRALLEVGAHLAATDLEGPALEALREELAADFPGRVVALPLDVTDPAAVAAAFATVSVAWGGVDLLVVNAGIAHAGSLEELDLDAFRRLSRVNAEGTLLLLAEAARHFRLQGTGGDVVLVSTKNVFAPGAGFGAYSATKAAAHQLARIASLELAPLGVRVNMVAPDAVFGGEGRRSGLWAEVGPARMRARGLDEAGLEEYYRQRNLLKARVTPRHVAEAVLFFATRRTPTTGATLPVDGGLPEATPR